MKQLREQGPDKPFFTIVIASFNNLCQLQICINSLNSQEYTSYEVLISDGGSVDGTISVLEDNIVRNLRWWKSGPDLGIYDALNMALHEARGRWIIVLGSDDRLSDANALGRAFLAIIQHESSTNLFYSDLFIRNSQSIRLKKYPDFLSFCKQYSGAPFIHHQTAFVSRDAVEKHGVFNTSYRIHADLDFMLRIIKNSPAVKIDDAFVEYDASGYSTRFENIIRSINEVQKIRLSHGFSRFNLRLGLIFLRQLMRTVFRGLLINKQ